MGQPDFAFPLASQPAPVAPAAPFGAQAAAATPFGGLPTAGASAVPFGGQPVAASFGNQPAPAFPSQPADSFGAAFPSQPAAPFGSQPAPAFPSQPAANFPSQPAASFPASGQPAFIANSPPAAAYNPTPVTDICLGCICQAISGCNQTLSCNGDVCGLFRITQPYWKDAGSPVQSGDSPSNAGAFERCVNEPQCAATTVQGYMSKYQQDCNHDNVINCYDHAAIHLKGGYACGGELPAPYSNTLQQCLAQAQNYQG